MTDFDPVFFTDLDGVRMSLDEVIYSGLDRDYSSRYPRLREYLRAGNSEQQAFAAAMLASWGVRDGLLAVTAWGRAPHTAPWVGEPPLRDRFTGVDSTFALLTDALRTAQDIDLTAPCVALRVDAARALLLAYDQVFFDRSMPLLMAEDRGLARTCASEIAQAVERSVRAARTSRWGFDMPSQAAFLVDSLAALDDSCATEAAAELADAFPEHTRMLREVAYSLGSGTGPGTLAVLRRLSGSPFASVAHEANDQLSRRATLASGI